MLSTFHLKLNFPSYLCVPDCGVSEAGVFFHPQKAAWKEGGVREGIRSLEAVFHQRVTGVGGFMRPFSSL